MNNLMDLGGGVGIFGTLLIGAVAGWIAEKLTGSSMGLIMNMLPGMGELQRNLNLKESEMEGQVEKMTAIYSSMTKKERRSPDIIHASRKKRIASGSGVAVQDVNKLLKQHADMLKMMKRVNKLGEKGFMRSLGALQPPPGFPR